MGTCVETLISAMKAEPWVGEAGRAELRTPTVDSPDRGMVDELGGVPRAALQTVFGQGLGRRIWECGRRGAAAGPVGNEEIVGGMIEYVSRRAAEGLRKNGRQAGAIGLKLEYADGVATLNRMRLARPTRDAGELLEAAMELLGRAEARGVSVMSVDLRLSSVQAEVVVERAVGFERAMTAVAQAQT